MGKMPYLCIANRIDMITVERYHDISMGHRVVGHESKCRHLHGHNYRIHFVCTAPELDGVCASGLRRTGTTRWCFGVKTHCSPSCAVWYLRICASSPSILRLSRSRCTWSPSSGLSSSKGLGLHSWHAASRRPVSAPLPISFSAPEKPGH